MKLCFVAKYPPIQGGVSRDNFWAAYALAQRGHEVHFVTNSEEVEYQFRIFEAPWLDDVQNTLPSNLVLHRTSSRPRHGYIPWANPFVTKLSTIATSIVEEYGCDLIYGHYFEPYALAAHLTSKWTGIPYGIRHAGSDVGRLFQSPELQTAYTHVIQDADFVIASRSTFRRFLHLGVDFDRIYGIVPPSLPTTYFRPSASPLDVNRLLETIRRDYPEVNYAGVFNKLAQKDFDPTIPTIGIYGKTGETKGSYDLLAALGQLRAEGASFNLLALTQGHSEAIQRFAQVMESYRLQDCTWLLPFMPHSRIPSFIKTCVAVCFLERDFPIKIHTPSIPKEVFACGTCLILSREIADKQVLQPRFKDRENVLLVEPTDINELAGALRFVIANPEASRAIGLNGYKTLSLGLEDFDAYSDRLSAEFVRIHEESVDRRARMSVAEMQACLARLYVDEPFRKLFHLAPDEALEGYYLTESERMALVDIDKKMLDFFAASLKHKRRGKYQRAYPLLFQLGPEVINNYYSRYYQLYPARPGQSSLVQILEFGEFMEQTLARDDKLPPYASDLARYERMHYAAAFAPSSHDAFSEINATGISSNSELNENSCPFVVEGVHVGEFSHDIVAITKAMREGQTPTFSSGKWYVLFKQEPNSINPKLFGINEATVALLNLCNRKRTVSEIIIGLGDVYSPSVNIESDVLQILSQLTRLQVVGVG